MLVKHAGSLTEPIRSVPIPNGDAQELMSAASPPEEPPGDLLVSYGFLVMPTTVFSVS